MGLTTAALRLWAGVGWATTGPGEGVPLDHSGWFSCWVAQRLGGAFQTTRSWLLDWIRLQPPKRFSRVASSR